MKLYVKKKGVKVMGIEFKIGAGGILTIILTLAKLAGLFPYSWWFVAAPLIAGYVVALILILVTIFGLAAVGYDDNESK